jgi:hypothetical protein
MQTASIVGPQGEARNSLPVQAVHAAHCMPSPVNPGKHEQATEPPRSMQSAFGLQPPLLIAHAPACAGMHMPATHASPGAHG